MAMIDDAMMGTAAEAKAMLMEKTREWRDLRRPIMGNSAVLRDRDIRENQVRFELATAALLWLWHEEEKA